jgi:hypothetical protein
MSSVGGRSKSKKTIKIRIRITIRNGDGERPSESPEIPGERIRRAEGVSSGKYYFG